MTPAAARTDSSTCPGPPGRRPSSFTSVSTGSTPPPGPFWLQSADGFLRQQCEQNVESVGLDDRPAGRAAHNRLLRFAFEQDRPGILGPRQRAEPDPTVGNPTDYALAVAPIFDSKRRTVGLVEIIH